MLFIPDLFFISSYFNPIVIAYWKHLLSFLLMGFIVAFLLFIQSGESIPCGTNFRVDTCSRFLRILLKFAKLNPHKIFNNRRFAKINPRKNFGNGKFAKINPREIFLLCFFTPFIFQATIKIEMCIMKL